MPAVDPLEIFVAGVERFRVEWDVTTEEVLGGVGSAAMVLQDMDLSFEPDLHDDVEVNIRATGFRLFKGEIMDTPVELPVGEYGFRRWRIACSDYNVELSQRLVGALDGRTWEDIDGGGDYVNIDPNAHSLATDKLTVQHLFDKYIRVNGQAIGTATFVGEYLPDLNRIEWEYSDLQSALAELARYIAVNVQGWIDPTLEWHWVAIPPWQELAGFGEDPDTGGIVGLFPEGDVSALPAGPVEEITDNEDDVNGTTIIGGRRLSFQLDGSKMPEQIYVRGSTGYVYNAGGIEPTGESTIINPTGYGSWGPDIYRLTFLTATRAWIRQSNGYISSSFTMASGGPYDVKFYRIPYNPDNGKGGHFWKLLTGPDAGKYIDNDSEHFGYGEIQVVRYEVEVIEPSIGIGGSGWVNEVVQDPNKRQAYLEAEISDTRIIRDSIGGQALYRGAFPTLRGSITVGGTEGTSPDGWRVGQTVKITDARLPSFLNGKTFLIQRVRTKCLPATDLREYTLDWGDGPESRYTREPKPADEGAVKWPPPVNQVVIQARDLSPGPNTSQVIYGQLTNKDGTPWKIAGRTVKWSMEVRTKAGTIVTGQGVLKPEVSATDKNGRARTVLTTGSQTDLVYFVFADAPVA